MLLADIAGMQHLPASTVLQEIEQSPRGLLYVKIALAKLIVAQPQQHATFALQITTSPTRAILTCAAWILRAADVQKGLRAF